MKCYKCKKDIIPVPIQGNTNLSLNPVSAIGKQMNVGIFDGPRITERMSFQSRSARLQKMIRSSIRQNKKFVRRNNGKIRIRALMNKKVKNDKDKQMGNIGRCPNCHAILSW